MSNLVDAYPEDKMFIPIQSFSRLCLADADGKLVTYKAPRSGQIIFLPDGTPAEQFIEQEIKDGGTVVRLGFRPLERVEE